MPGIRRPYRSIGAGEAAPALAGKTIEMADALHDRTAQRGDPGGTVQRVDREGRCEQVAGPASRGR